MTDQTPIRIAVIADNPDPGWVWIRDLLGDDFRIQGRPLHWSRFSTAPSGPLKSAGGRKMAGLGRLFGARALARASRKNPFDLVVSHGPWVSAWTASLLGKSHPDTRHLAFSFNFTDLPTGIRKSLMKGAFMSIDDFAVFTDAEQQLYANYFSLAPDRFLRAPWGVAPPLQTAPPRMIAGDYVAALGGEARDYETLCETARLCPDLQFVVVARPRNFDGLSPPSNLKVLFNQPFEEAWGIVAHAQVAVIPLRSRDTPCGLVTLIGAMHMGKAQVVSAAAGVKDYIDDGETGLLTPPGDPQAIAAALMRLQRDPALATRLGDHARAYAARACGEDATVGFFKDYLTRKIIS